MIMKSSTAVQRSWLFGAIVSILLIFFYIHNIDPDPVKLSYVYSLLRTCIFGGKYC